jgi:subtilase family serine protease
MVRPGPRPWEWVEQRYYRAARTIDRRVSQLYKYTQDGLVSEQICNQAFGMEECMRRSDAQSSVVLRSLPLLMALVLVGQPLWAQGNSDDHRVFPERPPIGYARPPIHMKGTSASTGPRGMSPSATRHAYGFDKIVNQGAGQVIGIVDAYDDPNIESDLGVFSSTFVLPPCTTSNNCFQKVYAQGSRPSTSAGWALEISLDVEWAHAIAPQAKILLVEAASNSFANLMQAVDVAVQHGASLVSMSFGGGESSSELSYDFHFNQNGVTFTASSGDSGSGVEYPAASPYVVAVGGTTLTTGSGGSYVGETAWSGSGGGQSAVENEPLYQSTYSIPNDPNGRRGVPDVAYDGDPNTGFAVYDTVRYQGQSGWFQVGGTSAGAPQWAALFSIANSLRAGNKATLSSTDIAVYNVAKANLSSNFHDISSGKNGTCGTLCTASTGYDYVTGLGSPQANNIIPALVSQ